MPYKFRKKPVVIEADRLTPDNINELEVWCGGSIKGTRLHILQRCIDVQTLEGEMRANMGDWIVKGVEGEFYPVKDSIFTSTYEEVKE